MAERVELEHALKILRAGDQFVVCKIEHLAQSTRLLIEISELLREKGVEFVSLKDNIDTSTANRKMMFGMLAVIAEFERDMLRERALSGLQSARTRGKVVGRRKPKKEKLKWHQKCINPSNTPLRKLRKLGIPQEQPSQRFISVSIQYKPHLNDRKDELA